LCVVFRLNEYDNDLDVRAYVQETSPTVETLVDLETEQNVVQLVGMDPIVWSPVASVPGGTNQDKSPGEECAITDVESGQVICHLIEFLVVIAISR